jgi:hypothetical protein
VTAEPAIALMPLPEPASGPREPIRFSRLLEPAALALLVATVLAVAYVAWSPSAPDLAAQSGRAAAARLTHIGTWWAGWFGGLPLVSYSLVVPPVMAVLGVPLTGGLAVIGTAAAGGPLVRGAVRPRVGAVALAVAATADVLGGRTTFAVGTAVAVAAALAMQQRRPGLGAALAALAVLCSPLAGLFLGIGAVTMLIAAPERRRDAALTCGVLIGVGLVLAVLSPGSGRMPFSARDLFGALCATAAVALLCPQRLARVGAAVFAAAEIFFFLVPSSVGVNIGRLTAVFGAAAVLAFSPWHRLAAVTAAIALTIGPGFDLVMQIQAGRDASMHRAYYQPLVQQLVRSRDLAGPTAAGQRVEVVDPRTHGDASYVAPVVPLARGWYRQADVANNPVFYQPGALTPATYRAWLDSLAVRWVALPNAPLDYASVEESKLIRNGLPYLHPVWQSAQWSLYEVNRPKPLADGAFAQPAAGALSVDVGRQGWVFLRVRWSPTLVLRTPVGDEGARLANQDGWVLLNAPDPGRYYISSRGLL